RGAGRRRRERVDPEQWRARRTHRRRAGRVVESRPGRPRHPWTPRHRPGPDGQRRRAGCTHCAGAGAARARRPLIQFRRKESLMSIDELVAIDIHTHAETSTRVLPDEAEAEALEARGRYFRYEVKHPTIAQM